MIKNPTVISHGYVCYFSWICLRIVLCFIFSIISSKKRGQEKKTENLKLQSFTKVGYCVYFSKK